MAKYSGYSIKAGAESGDYILLLDPSDTTQAATGTVKRFGAVYLVSTDGTAAEITGGGTIVLGGYTLSVSSDGTVDLGGNTLTAAQDVSFAGDIMTVGAKALDLASSGELDLATHKLTVGDDSISIDDVELVAYDPGGTIALGGSALSADGAGSLTLDGDTLDISAAVEGTAGSAEELAGWTAGGVLQGAGITRGTGAGVVEIESGATGGTLYIEPAVIGIDGETMTLNASATVISDSTLDFNGETLEVTAATGGGTLNLNGSTLNLQTSGTLSLNNQVLTLTGTGTLDLGLSRTLSVKDGNITLKGGGNEISLASDADLDMNGQLIKLPVGEGDAWLSFNGKKLTIDTDTSITGGGTLDLSGYTLTAAKDGTVATTDDLAGTAYNYITVPITDLSYTSGSTYQNVGVTRWLGTEWGAQSVQFWVGYRVTGAGTSKVRVMCGGDIPYENVHSTTSASFDETFYWTTAPATDADIFVAMSETSNTIYECYVTFRIEV